MKKILSALLCMALLLGFAACAAKDDSAGAAPATPEPAQSAETPIPAPAATPETSPEILSPAPLSAEQYEGDFSGYKRIIPTAAEASSSLDYFGKIFYPEYAADGDVDTCWQEAGNGNGIGESICLQYEDTVSASLIKFRLGYAKNSDGYYMNARPSRLLVEFSDGRSISCDCPDENDWYTIELSEAVELDCVCFTIEEVYGGDDYLDTCIAEIGLYTEAPGNPPETEYSGGLTPPAQENQSQPPESTATGYKEPYASYIELLENKLWASDFGIDLESSSRMEGKSLQQLWGMSWDEYLDSYPVNYFVHDFNGDGVDELMVTGDCIIGLIEDCYFFGWNGSGVVYLGCVEMTPYSIYKDGDGYVLNFGVTETEWERSLRFEGGVPVAGDWLSYKYDEGLSPSDRGLELVQYAYQLNQFTGEPYLEPLYQLGK